MEIKIFENAEFGSIRTAGTADEPLFCLSDVCRAVGLTNPSSIKSRLYEEDVQLIDLHALNSTEGTIIGNAKTNFVTESGFYDVLFQSTSPKVKPFRKWVTSEVLPSIRKKGGYIHTTEEDTPDVIMAKALILAQQTIEEKTKIIEAQHRTLEENRPKVAFAEAVEASSDCINVHTLAKIICQKGADIGEKRLYTWLRGFGLIRQGDTQPTQRATDMKLFRVVLKPNTKTGQYYPVTMVTPKGQQYILAKYFDY